MLCCKISCHPNSKTQEVSPFHVLLGINIFGKALCDLGASINLMPMSIFKKLGIGEARPTTISLQLADRSIAHPEGKIEDVSFWWIS